MNFGRFVLTYFWAFGAVVGIFNTFAFAARAKRLDQEENSKRAVGYLLFLMVVPPILLQVFQILGGYSNPLYIFAGDESNIFFILAIVTLLSCWFLVALLIWRGPLLPIFTAFAEEKRITHGVNYELAVKIAVMLVLAGLLILLVVGNVYKLYDYLTTLPV